MRMHRVFVVAGLLLALVAPAHASEEALDEARMALDTKLANTVGVISVGTGDCDGTPCINVFVEEMTPEVTGQIPAEFQGFKTKVQVGAPIGF